MASLEPPLSLVMPGFMGKGPGEDSEHDSFGRLEWGLPHLALGCQCVRHLKIAQCPKASTC